MSLRNREFLFLDCQTTGMRPPAAQMIELAWCWSSAEHATVQIHSHLIRLEGERTLPKKVAELTGIEDADLLNGVAQEFAVAKLREQLKACSPTTALIHYAQFEKPFLHDLHEPALEILCTQQILKRLIPDLPSFNIRAAAGYFGFPIHGIKRACSHVEATLRIWQGICQRLEAIGVHEEEFLRKWLKEKPASSRAPYAYRIDKLQRLALPDSPGVYRMLAKTGKILYVGKATSLKDRVNSYFRGRKGRDQRKLEMLAQVWDLRVTPCRTPLEAALLESDEIKRHDPPYNVALKTNDRRLLFYDRDFASTSHEFGDRHRLGPFRESNWIERLRLIVSSLEQNSFDQIFYFEIPPEDLHAGFELFCRTQGVDLDQLRTIRSLLALGMRQPPIIKCDAEDESENVDPITIEEIAAKFGRLLRRAADELLRARQMTRLLNCKIECGENRLEFRGGQIWKNGALADEKNGDWRGLGVETFDRLSIVLSELSRQPHRIECIKDRGQPGMSSIRAPSKADNNPLSP